MSLRISLLAAGALMLGAGAVSAQDLTGGHPDFSGAWTNYRSAGGPGAFTAPPGQIKLKPEAQAHADAYNNLIEGTNYAPGNACVGSGMPGSMLGSGGYPMEIIQRPDQVFVLYEAHNEIRRFYIGDEAGDPHDFFPERNGYSVAHWEGDRLIVETTNMKTQVDTRYPHSHEAAIHEEYYFGEPTPEGLKVLVAEMTMTDPLWLEEPFTTTKMWQELPDYHNLNYECTEPLWLDEMQGLYDAAGLEMVQE